MSIAKHEVHHHKHTHNNEYTTNNNYEYHTHIYEHKPLKTRIKDFIGRLRK